MSTIFSVVGEHHPSEQGLHQKRRSFVYPVFPHWAKRRPDLFFYPIPPARPWTGPQGHTSVTGYTRAAGVPGRNLIGCVPDRNRIVYPVAIPPPPSSPPSHCPTEISSGVCPAEIAACTLSQYRPRHHHPHLIAPPEKSLAQALKESGVPTMRGAPLYLY